MNTTYTKKLKTITVTFVNGETFEVADTVDAPTASNVLYAFQHEGGSYIRNGNNYGWFPTSSIAGISIAEADSDPITKTDGFCAEPASDELVIKICSTGEAPSIYCTDSPQKPITQEDLGNLIAKSGCADAEQITDCLNENVFVYYNGERLLVSQQGDWRNDDYSYAFDGGTNKMVFTRLTQ